MSDEPKPWQTGDEEQRFAGYLDQRHFDPDPQHDEYVLRNLVGATTYAELRQREDDAVGLRTMTLRRHGIPPSYDLEGLQALHRHLFQDVYEWAGELRTINIAKAGQPFAEHGRIKALMQPLGETIEATDNFRNIHPDNVPAALAPLYNAINSVHPFREGNGRTQREFLSALVSEAGFKIEWHKITGPINDGATQLARLGDLEPLRDVLRTIVVPRDIPPAYTRASGSGRNPAQHIKASQQSTAPRQPQTPTRPSPAPAQSRDHQRGYRR